MLYEVITVFAQRSQTYRRGLRPGAHSPRHRRRRFVDRREQGRQGIRQLPRDGRTGQRGSGTVITSYSIHYTKLYEDKPYLGRVGFISPVAEFTPKNVETETLRTSYNFV